MLRAFFSAACLTCVIFLYSLCRSVPAQDGGDEQAMRLPEPSLKGSKSIEECLASRRSVREYSDRALTIKEVSQLLWAAQGITADWGGRTAPSAGALYPLKIYLVVGKVEGLETGVWVYEPKGHSISKVSSGDKREALMASALGQEPIGDAPLSIVIAAIPEITMAKYGARSMRYIDNEVGCVCQNIYLQCESLGLGTVAIGAFDDDSVAEIVGTQAEVRLIMPVGEPL